MKAQERFADDDLVVVAQDVRVARQQTAAAVNERAVGRAEVLYLVLPVLARDAGVAARNLGFGIVRIQIDVRENAVIGVPAADVRFVVRKRKFGAAAFSAFDHQFGVSIFGGFFFLCGFGFGN